MNCRKHHVFPHILYGAIVICLIAPINSTLRA